MRRAAREVTFKFIFEYLFQNEKRSLEGVEPSEDNKLDENDVCYISSVYHGVIDNYNVLTDKISTFSSGYKLERIYKIDLAILLVATYEIIFMSDVPDGAAVNEAVELAKIYSTEKSSAFINGVLASIINEKNKG